MHLVLGSQRFDLRDRTVIVAVVPGEPAAVAGADAVWAPSERCAAGAVASAGLPVGSDAGDAADVHRLADAGVAAVALDASDPDALAAVAERGLGVLVASPPRSGQVDGARVLVHGCEAIDGGIACCTVTGEGPPAWAQAAVAAAAGVRVVRTAEPRSVRRVLTVVDRLIAARAGGPM